MSLKVIIPTGWTEITVNGLHQWDYGRTIEIHADGLPAMVEVHFACAGMSEAVVRSCSVIDGAVTAAVPDTCLEQTTPVVAWVYAVGETAGATILTITLPITPRTRPQTSATEPEAYSDRYTEAVDAMNALVQAANETFADTEERVDEALSNATNVVVTEVAEQIGNGALAVAHADRADTADTDADGEALSNLVRSSVGGFAPYFGGDDYEPPAEIAGGLIAFCITRGSPGVRTVLVVDVGEDPSNNKCVYSGIFYDYLSYGKDTGWAPLRLVLTPSTSVAGAYTVSIDAYSATTDDFYAVTNEYLGTISYKYLSKPYPTD